MSEDNSSASWANNLLEVAKSYFILEVEICDCCTCKAWEAKLKDAVSKAKITPPKPSL